MEDGVLRAKNAAALGSSLLACMALPWTACLFFYTVLHFTYVSKHQIAKERHGLLCGTSWS
jgi:hypothetical protein